MQLFIQRWRAPLNKWRSWRKAKSMKQAVEVQLQVEYGSNTPCRITHTKDVQT